MVWFPKKTEPLQCQLRYPYSARELLAVIRHLERFPNEPLEEVPTWGRTVPMELRTADNSTDLQPFIRGIVSLNSCDS